MTHTTRFAFAAAIALYLADDAAFAAPGPDQQSAEHKAPAKDKNGGKNNGKGGDDKDGKGGKKHADYVGPIKKDDYPIKVRMRPLTLSNGMFQGSVGFDYLLTPKVANVAVDNVLSLEGAPEAVDIGAPGLDLAYGLANVVDVHVSTSAQLSPAAAWNKTITIGGGFLAYDSHDYDLAVRVDLPIGFYSGAPLSLNLSAPMRYLIGEQFDLHGAIAVPFTFSPDFFAYINVLPGVGLQADRHWYLSLDTEVLEIGLGDSSIAPTTTLGDILPVQFTVNYAIKPEYDVGAQLILPDLIHTDARGWGLGIYGKARF